MVSAFDGLAAAAFAPHLSHFGVPVTYQAPEQDPKTITAVVGEERVTESFTGETRHLMRTRELRLLVDEQAAAGGVAEPVLRASVTVDGVVYLVRDVVTRGGATLSMTIERPDVLDVSRRRYRR